MKTEFSLRDRFNYLFWPAIGAVALVNLNTVFIGFHPHHDGLMLSTIRLLKVSFLTGGDYPFNQYGSFWAMPYLGISLLVSDSSLLVAMRVFTLLLYFLTAFLTFKIADSLFGNTVGRVSLVIFILARPIGLEPIPWPSSISVFLTTLIAFISIKTTKMTLSRQRSLLIFILGSLVVMSILTRVQIGTFMFVAICGYFLVTRRKDVFPFFMGGLSFTFLYGLWLHSMNWLGNSISDQFVFGWIVASSKETDRTFPLTSLIFLIFLLAFSFLGHKWLRDLRNTATTRWLSLLVFIGIIVLALRAPSSVQSLTGKFWVSVLLFSMILFCLKSVSLFRNREYAILLLGLIGMANASQIYPLFDPMHAWWGITPLSIYLAHWLVYEAKSFISITLRFQTLALISVISLIPYLNLSLTQVNFSMNSDDLALTYSGEVQAESYNAQREFFLSYIPKGSSVLNLCEDSDIFFNSDMYFTASRYFVYWPTMVGVDKIKDEMSRAQPEYVVVCRKSKANSTGVWQNTFVEPPYKQLGALEAPYLVEIYGLDTRSTKS